METTEQTPQDPRDIFLTWLKSEAEGWRDSRAPDPMYRELHRGIRLVGSNILAKLKQLDLYTPTPPLTEPITRG